MKIRASIAALALILSAASPPQLLARENPPAMPLADRQVAWACPFFDIASVPEIRRQIERVYEGTISSDPQTFALNAFLALASKTLPEFYVLSGHWYHLSSLRRDYRAVLGRPSQSDSIFRFHEALFGRDPAAMREIASLDSLPVSESFLAPVFELPELAALYAELFEGGEGLEAAFDRLARTAAAWTAKYARAPDDRQTAERDGDRERVSLAWLNFHLARVASRMPERRSSSAAYLATAASLLSPRCQPRTLEYFRAISSGQPPCEQEGLDQAVDIYVCWLPDVIMEELHGRESRRKPPMP